MTVAVTRLDLSAICARRRPAPKMRKRRAGCWRSHWSWKGGRGKRRRRHVRWIVRRYATGCLTIVRRGWTVCMTSRVAMDPRPGYPLSRRPP
jgi:hypothetical protein